MSDEIEQNDELEVGLMALARSIYPALRAFYDSPEGQAEFAAWKVQQTNAQDHT